MSMHYSLSPPLALLLLLALAAAPPSPAYSPSDLPPSASPSSDQSPSLPNSSAITTPASAFNRGFAQPYQRLTILIATLFVAFLFLGFCAHHVTLRSCYTQPSASRTHEAGALQPTNQLRTGEEARGLEPCIVRSLPVVKYTAKKEEQDLEEGGAAAEAAYMGKKVQVMKLQECAVCLSEYEEGEEMKELPVCGHCFHKACIDMWLFSHSTCPICRLSLRKHFKEPPMKSSTDQLASPRNPGLAPHPLPRVHLEVTMPLEPASASTSSVFHAAVVNSYDALDADEAEDRRNSSATLYKPHFSSSA